MKTITLRKLPLLLLLLSISIWANAEKSNTQSRNVASFSKISVSSGIDLYLTQGTTESVRVEADADLIDKIITEVNGETLRIYVKNTSAWNWGWNKTRKVYVTFDDLSSLDASAGSDVEAKGEVKVEKINISASSGSDVEFERLFAQSVRVEASSGADAEVAGETKNLTVDSSSGSDIDCEDLLSEVCKASASSGSDITVYVTQSLEANASSGGDISYKGNPSQKDIDESSGGDVSSF
ncbi:head GIN domain-containing protein [Mangrovibacterium diazotrophicum]|uniref:Putative autotransporter adhesin-like protein n=1 Tax=Mangrovibacterium diazotrophicum TaxID=1261403 RepID=A0A419W9C7_9BACT|nr:head GIN domain-containing protein [Mangrovibacterium diazotrophicum]RKD92014.1 putative autotransporter adhesin-like protein [Mangrovibacterium diazotrophicum]